MQALLLSWAVNDERRTASPLHARSFVLASRASEIPHTDLHAGSASRATHCRICELGRRVSDLVSMRWQVMQASIQLEDGFDRILSPFSLTGYQLAGSHRSWQ